MMKHARRLVAGVVLSLFAGAASADCPTTSEIGAGDTVLQFNTGPSAAKGYFGPKSKSDYRKEGSLYYHAGSNSLKLCDGTNWTTVLSQGGSGGAPTGGGMVAGGSWSKDVTLTNTNTGSTRYVGYSVPIDPTGSYAVQVYVYTNHRVTTMSCGVSIQKSGGAREGVVAVSPKDDSNGNQTQAMINVAYSVPGSGDGKFTWIPGAMTTSNPSQSSASDNIGMETHTWNGTMEFYLSPKANINNSCRFTAKVIRTS